MGRNMLAKKKALKEAEEMRKRQQKLALKRQQEREEREWREKIERETRESEASAARGYKKYDERLEELDEQLREAAERHRERCEDLNERLSQAREEAEELKSKLEDEIMFAAAEPAKQAAAQKTKLEECKKLKETNERLVAANESAGVSFNMLQNQSKKLNNNTANVNSNIEKMKTANAKLREDLKARQAFYNAEAQIRLQYQKTLAQILDVFQDNCKDAD